MKNTILALAGACAIALISGCGSPATYTDSTNTKTAVVSLDKVNVQDLKSFSDQMIQSLLNSGVLSKAPTQPAVMAIDRVVNKTSNANLDTSIIEKNIRIALNQSGKVLTTTTYGRHAESQMAQDIQTKNDFLGGDKPVDRSPDFTLTGKVIEDVARAGNTRQVTYFLQLSLTDTHSGLAVWEEQKDIQKTGTRGAVGW